MGTRTAAEVGSIVKRRREALGLRQEEIPNVSSSLVRTIEKGRAPLGGRGLTRAALMSALQWPPDALERLADGADPDDFDREPDPPALQMAASGADLEELRRLDPEAYAHIEALAVMAIERARQRARS